MQRHNAILLALVALLAGTAVAHGQQPSPEQKIFTRADTLRGSNGPAARPLPTARIPSKSTCPDYDRRTGIAAIEIVWNLPWSPVELDKQDVRKGNR